MGGHIEKPGKSRLPQSSVFRRMNTLPLTPTRSHPPRKEALEDELVPAEEGKAAPGRAVHPRARRPHHGTPEAQPPSWGLRGARVSSSECWSGSGKVLEIESSNNVEDCL